MLGKSSESFIFWITFSSSFDCTAQTPTRHLLMVPWLLWYLPSLYHLHFWPGSCLRVEISITEKVSKSAWAWHCPYKLMKGKSVLRTLCICKESYFFCRSRHGMPLQSSSVRHRKNKSSYVLSIYMLQTFCCFSMNCLISSSQQPS